MTDMQNNRRVISGPVVSDKRDKSIIVLMKRKVKHPKYGKYIVRQTKLHAHDENNIAKIGDIVTIEESRPISKQKCWILKSINEKAEKVA